MEKKSKVAIFELIVEGFTVHDADSHVMELPGEIDRYVEPGLRAAFSEAIRKPGDLTGWEDKARALQDDPEFRSGDEANLLLRKNYQALGAFRREDTLECRDDVPEVTEVDFDLV